MKQALYHQATTAQWERGLTDTFSIPPHRILFIFPWQSMTEGVISATENKSSTNLTILQISVKRGPASRFIVEANTEALVSNWIVGEAKID